METSRFASYFWTRSVSFALALLAAVSAVDLPASSASAQQDAEFWISLLAALQQRAASPRSTHSPGADPSVAECARWEIQYVTRGTLWVTETPRGAGNGTFAVGPGTLVLRVDTRASQATLRRFDLREHFASHPSAVIWSATVTTDAAVRMTALDSSEGLAVGTLSTDGVLRWSSPLRNYRSEGALTCDGSLCGKFGAPPRGRNALHEVTRAVALQPLRFDRDGGTFQMDFALVSASEAPRQRTYLALAGRRTTQTCIQANALAAPAR